MLTNPALVRRASCSRTPGRDPNGASIPAFNPLLGCYDLTRTAPLPGSDGCPTVRPAAITPINGHSRHQGAGALRSKTRLPTRTGRSTSGCEAISTTASPAPSQVEPRLGVAYNIKPTNTVLRVSYARTLETPFNENLILASTGLQQSRDQSRIMAVDDQSLRIDNAAESRHGAMSSTPACSRPSGNTWWSMASTSGSTRTRPTTSACWATRRSLSRSSGPDRKSPDTLFAPRVPNFHGFTAYVVMSHVAARFFEPQVSGIGAAPVWHARCSASTTTRSSTRPLTCNTSRGSAGPGSASTGATTAGLVAGPVPCAGGNCANGPNGGSGPNDWWTPPSSRRISSSRRDSSADGPRDADDADQLDLGVEFVPRVEVRLDAGEDSGARHGERRPQSAAHRAAESVRPGRRRGQPLPRRPLQVEPAIHGRST